LEKISNTATPKALCYMNIVEMTWKRLLMNNQR